jgi:hypothetical protein
MRTLLAGDQGGALGRDRRSPARVADLPQMVRGGTHRRQPLNAVYPARVRTRVHYADRQRRGVYLHSALYSPEAERGLRCVGTIPRLALPGRARRRKCRTKTADGPISTRNSMAWNRCAA